MKKSSKIYTDLLICLRIGTGVGATLASPEYPGLILAGAGLLAG